ncbi:MAG: phosphoenolpyruvate--protein phosphotransferase [Chloroflexota bacterium]
MKKLTLVIQNETGLHARPAKTLVNLAKTFQSKISVQHGEKEVNAKSMIGILKLGVKKSGEITVCIDGEDEEEAAVQIETAVTSGLGETPHAASAPNATNGHANAPHAASSPNLTNGHSDAPPLNPAVAENQILGVSASPGIAIGPVFQLKRQAAGEKRPFLGIPEEKAAFQQAVKAVDANIHNMKAQAAQTLTAEEAEIFEAHLEILNDPALQDAVDKGIEQQKSAAEACQIAIDEQAEQLASLSDATLAGRATDVRDIGNQILTQLGAGSAQVVYPERPFILIADDLTPSETVSLDRDKVLGFGTSAGGPTAHSAILARALKLPAVVGAGEKIEAIPDDTIIILDGKDGVVTINPTKHELETAQNRLAALERKQAEARKKSSELALTKDGHRVEVVANIGSPSEAQTAYELGAEGVGLLRTEFLFLEQTEPPSEAFQFDSYKQIVVAMKNQPVIVRTLDIGGDKPVPYLSVGEEANPFLGERGIRLCLTNPEIFKTQLRAILRASAFGNLLIMFPMVSDVSELIKAREMVTEIANELNELPAQIGMMIEVPAAALMVDQFAPYLDFVSIGTNDLTQYTLAIDRQHPTLAKQSDGLHPAVLRLIDQTVKAAHQAGKWVGVCGELAADPQALPILVGLGVDELSVNMNAIPDVKAQVRTLALADANQLAQKALMCATAEAVRKLV